MTATYNDIENASGMKFRLRVELQSGISKENGKKILDLKALGFDKLLGGGKVKNAYSIKIDQFTSKAEDKVKTAGGELLKKGKKIDQFSSNAKDDAKNAGEELVEKDG